MNKQIKEMIDEINGVEIDKSDKIMQCEVCEGFYPVSYNWITLIRCHECGWLDYALYNQNPVSFTDGEPIMIHEGMKWYIPRLGY